MARFRLRFLLQEIDLPEGETVIGRSTDSHVTIEDPLVSRQHARISVRGALPTIEDLGSRNGTFVNGRAAQGVLPLDDGDRIRVGTLELVFCRAQERQTRPRPQRRTTGFMCHCGECGNPYPSEAQSCPSCGSDLRVDDDTLSGVLSEVDRNWTLELLVDVLTKAVTLQRWDDVERMLRRARSNVEARVATDHGVEVDHLAAVGEAAVRLSVQRAEADWAAWVLTIHATLAEVPAEGVLTPLDLMPDELRQQLAPSARRLLSALEGRLDSRSETPGLVRVRALARSGGPS